MSRPYCLPMFAVLFASLVTISSPAHAQFGPNEKIKQPVTAAACKPQPGKTHFIEFRSRTAASYGHSFLLHGKLGTGGKFGKFEVAGLHPKGYDPEIYMQGHVMPVPAETGASWGDLDEQYLTARYCVVLSEAEYQRASAYIRRLQATSKEWHAPTNNCNSFIGDVARHMGLLAPPTPILLPEHFVGMIKDLNGNKAALSGSARS
jgi:hypothetical protein